MNFGKLSLNTLSMHPTSWKSIVRKNRNDRLIFRGPSKHLWYLLCRPVGIVYCYSCAKVDGASSNQMDSRRLSWNGGTKMFRVLCTCVMRLDALSDSELIAFVKPHRCAKFCVPSSKQLETIGSPEWGRLWFVRLLHAQSKLWCPGEDVDQKALFTAIHVPSLTLLAQTA